MRDRLIEAINKFDELDFCIPPDWWIEHLADYLLANGVIVPPCKVGDTVWFDTYANNGRDFIGVQPHTVYGIYARIECDAESILPTKIPFFEIGKTVFLTREEAENALAERRNRDAE